MPLTLKQIILQNDAGSIQNWINNTTVNTIEGMVALNSNYILIFYT